MTVYGSEPETGLKMRAEVSLSDFSLICIDPDCNHQTGDHYVYVAPKDDPVTPAHIQEAADEHLREAAMKAGDQ
jgi:hypothetical protein